MKTDSKFNKTLINNWRDEKESAWLYQSIAALESDPQKKSIFEKLSSIENQHAAVWQEEIKRQGLAIDFSPRLKVKLYLFLAQRLGASALLDILEQNEQAKIRRYFKQLEFFTSRNLQDQVRNLFAVEKSHINVLSYLKGKPLSPFKGGAWHKGGGAIRDIIFGMNDGLLSIFSLVAGVAGGTVERPIVLLAGLAGTVAGAISMAAGAFVSTRAEREVLEQQLAIERKELEVMPESEKNELQMLYQQKGVARDQAEQLARTIISNKDVALDTMAREELGFSPSQIVNPYYAALCTGAAFIVGAAVPIIPFLLALSMRASFRISIVCSLSSFFIIGAGRTIVTGKKAWRSGLEMFIIGTLAAGITYLVGTWIGGVIR